MPGIDSICDFGWNAPNFSLKGVDGNIHALTDLRGPNGTLIIFMCQHCPYVEAIIDDLSDEGLVYEEGCLKCVSCGYSKCS